MNKFITFICLLNYLGCFTQPVELLLSIGHSKAITCLDISEDGKYLVSGSRDNLIKLWNLKTGLNIKTFVGHRRDVLDVKFSSDSTLISVAKDYRIHKWNIEDKKINYWYWEFDTLVHRDFEYAYLSERGKFLAYRNKSVYYYLNALKIFSTDFKYDVNTHFSRKSFPILDNKVESVAFSKNEDRILLNHSHYRGANYWKINSFYRQHKKNFRPFYREKQTPKLLVSSSYLNNEGSSFTNEPIILSNDQSFFIQTYERKVCKWQLKKKRPDFILEFDMKINASILELSSDDKFLFMAVGNELLIIDCLMQEILSSKSFSSRITSMEMIQNTDFIAIGQEDGKILIWNYVNDELKLYLGGSFHEIAKSSFSIDGRNIIFSSNNKLLAVDYKNWRIQDKQITSLADEVNNNTFIQESANKNKHCLIWDNDKEIFIIENGEKSLLYTKKNINDKIYFSYDAMNNLDMFKFEFNDIHPSGIHYASYYKSEVFEGALLRIMECNANNQKCPFLLQYEYFKSFNDKIIRGGETIDSITSNFIHDDDFTISNKDINLGYITTLDLNDKNIILTNIDLSDYYPVMEHYSKFGLSSRWQDLSQSNLLFLDKNTLKLKGYLMKDIQGVANSVIYSNKYNKVFAGWSDGTVKSFDINLFKPIDKINESAPDYKLSLELERAKHILDYHKYSDGESGNEIGIFNSEGLQSFFQHNDGVKSISISNDSILLTNSTGGILHLWNINSFEKIVELIPYKTEQLLYRTPSNYYYIENKLINNIGFKQGKNIYSFEQFDLKYNRPDIVLSKLDFTNKEIIRSYHQAYQKRLKKLNFTEDMLSDDFHVPEIVVETENIPVATNQQQVSVEVKATDTQQKLDRLNVYINDVPIYGINGINLRPQNTQSWEQELKLILSQGENKIQISALNQGGAESLKETFYITYDAPKTKPTLYLIGIAADNFSNDKLNLTYPIKDIQDWVATYTTPTDKYQKVVIKTLYNNDISIENLQALKATLQQSQVDDQVILFVAGHGLLDDSLNYYLATPMTDFNNPANGGILYEDLENLLDGIPARQKLFLLDACHSGEIDKEETKIVQQEMTHKDSIIFRSFGNVPQPKNLGLDNSFELMKQLFVDLRRGTGATVISSASGGEFAREGEEWNNSVFTYCLLSGLKERKADLDNDGQIMVSELQKYLAQEVPALTKGHQQPTMRVENISNDWRVW